jgi:hypothetical protein
VNRETSLWKSPGRPFIFKAFHHVPARARRIAGLSGFLTLRQSETDPIGGTRWIREIYLR